MHKLLYVCCLFVCSKIVMAQAPTTVYLWEKGSPNDVSTPKSERPRIDIWLWCKMYDMLSLQNYVA